MKSRIYSSRAETVPLLGVPGGSLFTFTLRGVLASPGWSWVGDCSLSWGEGEWSWGDGDCNCGRDWGWDRGDWSWGTGDWSVAGGWGPGDWSWGPPPGFGVSSLPCLAPAGPLKPGSIWERGSISTDTLEIYRQETNEKEMQIKGVKNKVLKDNWGKRGKWALGKLQRLQLVAEPTVETKSKKINMQLGLQRLSCNWQHRIKAQRKISRLDWERSFLTPCHASMIENKSSFRVGRLTLLGHYSCTLWLSDWSKLDRVHQRLLLLTLGSLTDQFRLLKGVFCNLG